MNIAQANASPHVQPQPRQSSEESREINSDKRAEKLESEGISQHGRPQPKESSHAVDESRQSSAPEAPENQKQKPNSKSENASTSVVDTMV